MTVAADATFLWAWLCARGDGVNLVADADSADRVSLLVAGKPVPTGNAVLEVGVAATGVAGSTGTLPAGTAADGLTAEAGEAPAEWWPERCAGALVSEAAPSAGEEPSRVADRDLL